MTKRDYISEITARRTRLLKHAPRWQQLSKRTDDLIDIAYYLIKVTKKEASFKNELAKYMPIGWVACIEGYFRLVFRDVIDYGPPFSNNAANFKDIKIGLEHVVAMAAGKLTLGEFISHLLPANGLEDIMCSMSTLLDTDFLEELKHVKTDLFEPNKSLEDLELTGKLLESMRHLFENRHIYAHELTSKFKVNVDDTIYNSRAALIFMHHAETVVSNYLK